MHPYLVQHLVSHSDQSGIWKLQSQSKENPLPCWCPLVVVIQDTIYNAQD